MNGRIKQMKSKLGKVSKALIIVVILVSLVGGFLLERKRSQVPSGKDIEKYVLHYMEQAKIQGLSYAIVDKDKIIEEKNLGYADKSSKKKVTNETLYEIGSNSKAFTALGVLTLVNEEKISLEDTITQYIPWLKLKYESKQGKESYPDIKISDLLYHTSGIPYNSIASIPEDSSNKALENTIRSINNSKLDDLPGTKFCYATINYDILGLLIEYVSGMSYETFIRQNVLDRYDLHNTFVLGEDFDKDRLAKSYKISFSMMREYQSPVFKGNAPAGYIISTIDDMAKWLMLQISEEDELIAKAHVPNRDVPPDMDGSSYAMGWNVFQSKNGKIAHGGTNPGFSSYVVYQKDLNKGIVVLANTNSEYVGFIAENIMKIIAGNELSTTVSDTMVELDQVITSLFVMCFILVVGLVILFKGFFVQVLHRKVTLKKITKSSVLGCIASVLLATLILYNIYSIPEVFFSGLNWSFTGVWGPGSFMITMWIICLVVVILFIYLLIEQITTQQEERISYIELAMFSLIAAFGSVISIFIIKQAISTDERSKFLLYFCMGMLMYVYFSRYSNYKIIRLVSGNVCKRRVEFADKILHAQYDKLANINESELYSCFNNDTEVLSEMASATLTVIMNLLTVVICFIYLGLINFKAMIFTIISVIVAAGCYYAVSSLAGPIFARNRELQLNFYSYIDHLLKGIKELYISRKKREEFQKDFTECCESYKESKIKSEYKVTDASIVGTIMITSLLASIVFVLPHFIKSMNSVIIASFFLIFMYIVGPINTMLQLFPTFFRMKISYQKINSLLSEVGQAKRESLDEQRNEANPLFEITLSNIKYSYKKDKGRNFSIHDINASFQSGEIVFVIGGNGSGKSTVAKLIAGLYQPDEGEILFNGVSINDGRLSEKIAMIFTDNYIFQKLYGIDFESKQKQIDELSRMLKIEDVVSITDGNISTLKLSSGQRKRVALLVSLLEDKQIYLFDEWAAEQDPEFRDYFYNVILVQLKEMGKCVIVISHDDRYFDIADRIVKLDAGTINKN